MTQPMQATGNDGKKGAPDGVSDAPGKHGGQSGAAYHGTGGHPDPDKDNPNAVTEEG